MKYFLTIRFSFACFSVAKGTTLLLSDLTDSVKSSRGSAVNSLLRRNATTSGIFPPRLGLTAWVPVSTHPPLIGDSGLSTFLNFAVSLFPKKARAFRFPTGTLLPSSAIMRMWAVGWLGLAISYPTNLPFSGKLADTISVSSLFSDIPAAKASALTFLEISFNSIVFLNK